MKTFFIWLWFLIGIFMAYNNRLEASIACFVMAKLFELELKMDNQVLMIYNEEQEGDENAKR